MKCPDCHREVTNENINIQTDVAKCQSCNHIFKISEQLSVINNDGFEIDTPPKGAWINKEANNMIIGASTRSPVAFFIVPFMIVWSGFSLSGIYGSQIVNGEFDLSSSLFGIPFLIGSVIFWSMALMAIWGKVELTLDRKGGKVFTGIGSIGLAKRFTWDEISTIKEMKSNVNYPGGQGNKIQMEGKRRISFGTGLNESRRYYVLRAMKEALGKMKANRNFL